MLFKNIIDQKKVKDQLLQAVDAGRIPHAQLFAAPDGTGALPLAIAYAQYLLCRNTGGENDTGHPACNQKCNKLAHPDLHFAFPVATTDKVKKHPVSDLFLEEWRDFINTSPYGSLSDWYRFLNIENKQGQIGVDEAESIVKKLSLKSYEGGYKVLIIWMAEKLNTAAANKLLKLIEEPPNNTIIILVVEQVEQLIGTIVSRCQQVVLPPLSENEIKSALTTHEGVLENEAAAIAQRADGSWNKALQLLRDNTVEAQFEKWFIAWVRTAFKAKGNPAVIRDLIQWSETIAGTGRETQKNFLGYCLRFFRQAMLYNYGAVPLVHLEPGTKNFDLKKFAPFIHSANVLQINQELNDAIYHIERNGNAKVVLLDLSIKLTRLLHTKEVA